MPAWIINEAFYIIKAIHICIMDKEPVLSVDEFVQKPTGEYVVLFHGWRYLLAKHTTDIETSVDLGATNEEDNCFSLTYHPEENHAHIRSILYNVDHSDCHVPEIKAGTELLALGEAIAQALGATTIGLSDESTVERLDEKISLAYYHMAANDNRLSWYESKGYRPKDTTHDKFLELLQERKRIFQSPVHTVRTDAMYKTTRYLATSFDLMELTLDKAIVTATDGKDLVNLLLMAEALIPYEKELEKPLKVKATSVLSYRDNKRIRVAGPFLLRNTPWE
jgi:hypothetical protein